MAEKVTLCIPAYQAEAFLDETLASAFAQTWKNLEILISVDASTDNTAAIARAHRDRPWTRIVVHNRRLGWIGNTNYVLSQVRSRYAMILPHDDLIDRDYVETCMAGLLDNTSAAICYSDLDTVDGRVGAMEQPSVMGNLNQRLTSMLRKHFAAVAFRGVFDRMKAPNHAIPQAIGGFAADTLWFTRLGCQGELIRIPGVRYHKRMLESSAHLHWFRATATERHEMWAVHCLEMAETIFDACPSLEWTPELQSAWIARVIGNMFSAEKNPLYTDVSRSVTDHVSDIFERVRRRPVPYGWVRSS